MTMPTEILATATAGLARKTESWIAGLRLAALSLQKRDAEEAKQTNIYLQRLNTFINNIDEDLTKELSLGKFAKGDRMSNHFILAPALSELSRNGCRTVTLDGRTRVLFHYPDQVYTGEGTSINLMVLPQSPPAPAWLSLI